MDSFAMPGASFTKTNITYQIPVPETVVSRDNVRFNLMLDDIFHRYLA